MLKSDPRNSVGERELKELEDAIDDLRHRFEVFFAGLDNIDPSDKRIRIRGLISRLNSMHIKNAGIRFRYQSVLGRFVTMSNYWDRILRQIENGQFKRDLFRAKLREDEQKKTYYGKEDAATNQTLAADEDDGAAASHPTLAATPTKAPSPSAAAQAQNFANIGNAQATPAPLFDPLDQTIATYLDKKRSIGEATASISRGKLREKLETQREALKQKYQARDVEFRVEEADGKVILKPILKK